MPQNANGHANGPISAKRKLDIYASGQDQSASEQQPLRARNGHLKSNYNQAQHANVLPEFLRDDGKKIYLDADGEDVKKPRTNAGVLNLKPGDLSKNLKTDRTRWRLVDEGGRQTWKYLKTDEEVKAWPQSTATKWHLGLETVRATLIYTAQGWYQCYMLTFRLERTESLTSSYSSRLRSKRPHLFRNPPTAVRTMGL